MKIQMENKHVIVLKENNLTIFTQSICRKGLPIQVFNRTVMKAAGSRCAKDNRNVLVGNKSVLRTFTRASHTVHYSPEKSENKRSGEPFENWVSPTETRLIAPEIKSEIDKSYPIKHPKVLVVVEIADPEKKRHLNICFTHKLPKPYWQMKYDFRVLAYAYFGKDPKNPKKDHYLIITDRVLTTTEIKTVPENAELTAYLKSHPRYPDIVSELVKRAIKTLADFHENAKFAGGLIMGIPQNLISTYTNNNTTEKQLYFPLPEKKELNNVPTPNPSPVFIPISSPISMPSLESIPMPSTATSLCVIKPVSPPMVLIKHKNPNTKENLKNLAKQPLAPSSTPPGDHNNNNHGNEID